MAARDPTAWMWAEACQLLDEAEHLHRQFFRLGAGERISWEPPVDMFEDADQLTIMVALPGVPPEAVNVTVEPRSLLVRAERRLPATDQACAIRRLEIPHGYFERRIALPPMRLESARREWVNGCLVLVMRKV